MGGYTQSWKRLCPGQTVKFRGRVTEGSSFNEVEECCIIEKGPSPAIEMQAEELAKLYATNPKATNARFQGKSIFITGQLAMRNDVSRSGPKQVEFVLKGNTDVEIICQFHEASDAPSVLEATPGSKISLVCDYSFLDRGPKAIVLTNARVIFDTE